MIAPSPPLPATAQPSPARWNTVVVLFHPDEASIASLLNLRRWGYDPVAVVNAAGEEVLDRLREGGVTDLIVNNRNIGLAAALNQGITHAAANSADYVLLLDQDSRPGPEMGSALVDAATRAAGRGTLIGCVGPILIDRKASAAGEASAAVLSADATARPLLPAPSIATSGSLVSVEALQAVGTMWDALFIDGIDHEWCFRARAAGFGVFVAATAHMQHDMGDRGITFMGRYKPIHKSAFRHFYMVRNGLWLTRRAYIPPRWRAVEAAKFLYRVPVWLLVSSNRTATAAAMVRGLWQGLRHPPAEPPDLYRDEDATSART